MTKKLQAGAAVVTAGVLLALAAPAIAQTTITLSSWVPPRHMVNADVLLPWSKMVEKETQGRVKIKTLSKAVGKPPAHFDIARKGLADMTFGVHGYTPGRFVLTQAVELPFLGNKSEHTSVAYWRMYKKYMAKANEHKGIKLITVFTHGPGSLMSTKGKIGKVADLKGMKMRIGGGVVHEVAKRLEVVPMFKPAPQVYELLSRGVADGVFFPLEGINGFRLEKIVKHVTTIPGGLYNTSFFVAMNPKKYNSIPKKDRDIIDKLSGEFMAKMAGKAWDKRDAHSVADLKKAGGQVHVASSAMVAEIKKRTADVEGAWVKRAAKTGVDGKKLLADLRAEIKKLSGGK